ncbi:hypothetical protein [Chitinimonas naiadis]
MRYFHYSDIDPKELESEFHRAGVVRVILGKKDGDKLIEMMKDRIDIISGEGFDRSLIVEILFIFIDALKSLFRHRLGDVLAFWGTEKIVKIEVIDNNQYCFEFKKRI